MTAVQREDLSFVDADGVTIHYYRWAAARPRGVVQLAHGLGEHALRYTYLVEHLVAHGYTVYADDHRGHGRTGMEQYGGDVSRLGRLGVGGLRATVRDLRELSSIIRRQSPGVPLILLGHSWGSLMAQMIINESASDYDAVILTGTAYRIPGQMNSGDLNRRHAHLGTTGFEWLSRDVAVQHAFAADELTFPAAVIKLFGLADALRLLGRPSRHLDRDIPVLIMIGSDDPVGGEGSVRRLASAYRRRSGLSDVTTVIYPEDRHEIFNELDRDHVNADVTDWLDGHFAVGRDEQGAR